MTILDFVGPKLKWPIFDENILIRDDFDEKSFTVGEIGSLPVCGNLAICLQNHQK
jgi:hypothetical protein